MEHLSPEWIEALDHAVRGHEGLRRASADRRVVLSYTVSPEPVRPGPAGAPPTAGAPTTTGGPGDVAYTLVLDHGDNRVQAGAAEDADVTFRTDRATAAAIASHAESAQTAFMAGRLRLGGDVRALMANQDLLVEVDD